MGLIKNKNSKKLVEFYESIICSLQDSSQSKGPAQDLEKLLQITDLKIGITHFALENLLHTLQSKIWLYIFYYNKHLFNSF